MLPKSHRALGDMEALQSLEAHNGGGNSPEAVLAQVQVRQVGGCPGQRYLQKQWDTARSSKTYGEMHKSCESAESSLWKQGG